MIKYSSQKHVDACIINGHLHTSQPRSKCTERDFDVGTLGSHGGIPAAHDSKNPVIVRTFPLMIVQPYCRSQVKSRVHMCVVQSVRIARKRSIVDVIKRATCSRNI